MQNAILTVKEASAILRISTAKTYQLIRENTLPHIKLGTRCVIPREQLLTWVNHAVEGGM